MAALAERSHLTSVQLATLNAHRQGHAEQAPLARQIAFRTDRRVSKGAFLRTLRQAQRNISRAAYTMLLLEAMDYLGEEDLAQFLRAGKLLHQVRSQALDPEGVARVMATVEAVVRALGGGSRQKPQIS